MTAQVIPIVSDDALDRAWAEYADYAREVVDDPRLLVDRKFFQEFTRRPNRWRRLFLVSEARL